MNSISKIVIPIVVLYIIYNGLKNHVDIYNSFLTGAKDGLITSLNIFPAILAMVFAVNIFLNSGIINFLLSGLKVLFNTFNMPFEVLPLAMLRPISGTASLAFLNEIFASYGPDSYIGNLSSIIQGCTDTTIYVLALYFGSIKITKTRYALPVGLFADLVGITTAFILAKIFFGS
jgi:spore maturation protein B